METGLLVAASRLSDRELLRRVVALAGHERRATVELVAHLAELDKPAEVAQAILSFTE